MFLPRGSGESKIKSSKAKNKQMKHRESNSRLVYSTETGRVKPSDNSAKNKKKLPKPDGKISVERSTKGRKGKGVSLIRGLVLGDADLKMLAKKLKQKCGTGGTVKDGVIEIQGDHRTLLVEELNSMGYKAKKAGG